MKNYREIVLNALRFITRSNLLEVFYKNVVLKNFAKFTGKHLSQSLFLIKLLASHCNFIKKETLEQVLSSEFC